MMICSLDEMVRVVKPSRGRNYLGMAGDIIPE